MPTAFGLRSWRIGAAGAAALLLMAGCAQPPGAPAAAASASVVPAGMARIWFYRDYEPSVSLNFANVGLNGARVASVQADGGALYRDVPPGHYHISADSAGMDVNQTKDVDLAAGQEAYVKVLASGSWESGGDMQSYQRDTFYISLVPPQVARAELSSHPLTGG
jgi:hypothetical protein